MLGSTSKYVTKNLLGNHKIPDYKDVVERMLEMFKAFGYNTNLKVHYLHAHLDHFPENFWRCERRTVIKVPPGHKGNGKNVSRKVES